VGYVSEGGEGRTEIVCFEVVPKRCRFFIHCRNKSTICVSLLIRAPE